MRGHAARSSLAVIARCLGAGPVALPSPRSSVRAPVTWGTAFPAGAVAFTEHKLGVDVGGRDVLPGRRDRGASGAASRPPLT